MIRRHVYWLLSALVVWGVQGLPAEAACTGSRIDVAAVPMVVGSEIPVAWRITPPCDVIETGLLVGATSSDLQSVGTPIHAMRGQYDQVVTVGESGGYWFAAYAVDEAGVTIQSSPRFVPVLVPPVLLSPYFGRHGSHGPPPSYTGTEEDFLIQAGEPHYASLRRLDSTIRSATTESPFGFFAPFTGSDGRTVASPHPEEIHAGQGQPFVVGDFTFNAEPSRVRAAIDELDQKFIAFGHPRPGLYHVTCGIGITRGVVDPAVRCNPDPRVYRLDLGGVGLAYRELFSEQHNLFRDFKATISLRSSVAYFVPRLQAGRQLVSARFRVLVGVMGNPADMRLSGRAPLTIDRVSGVCGGRNFCSVWATWDFTPEATVLATQGGGELVLTLDPIPPAFDEIFSTPNEYLRNVDGSYSMLVDVNYPWAHRDEARALTLSFTQSCARQLSLSVTPSSVRPKLPGAVPVDLATLPTTATVEAIIQTCPPNGGSPATVEVIFEVKPPRAGSIESGGHLHDSRPATARGALTLGGQPATRCVAVIDSAGMGSCALLYEPSEVGNVETIVGRASGFTDAEAKIAVEIPGLVNLADVQTNFFRLTGARAGLHTDNHWGTATTTASIQLVALDFFALQDATLGINDLSLPSGGLFDISGGWTPPHESHRTGKSVDIDRQACRGLVASSAAPCRTSFINVPRDFIERRCRARGAGRLIPEATLHCEFPR